MSQVNPIPEHHHEDALDHRVYVKGENTPVVERIVTSSFVELTPGEQPRMTRGKTFVWTVAAPGKDGSTISAGQQTFKVR